MLFGEIVYGPIHSRRLGVSLGVNLMPSDGKICSFDCLYCECGLNGDGRTKSKRPTREEVREGLTKVLRERHEKGEPLNVITFAGNGEPTCHPDFAGIIDDTVEVRNRYFPEAKVSVLSNATMLHKTDVFEALKKVDNNIQKLDTVDMAYINKVDRPQSPSYDVKNIIEQLKALVEDTADATLDKVKELQAQWNEIGHVPFREKDRLFKEYRALADELYKRFGASQARRRLEGFQKSVRQAVAKGESTLSRERERLLRVFEARKAEFQTYENNLNFLNAKSKSGNSLIAEMNRKVEKLREELDLLSSKIKAIEAEMRAETKKED